MPRYRIVNGKKIQFTAEEETLRDVEEKTWAEGELDRNLNELRDLRNNLLKQLDDFTGLPVVKPNETFLKWRARFLRERINFIINEIPKQRVTRSKTGQKTAEAIIDSALKQDVEQFYLKWFLGVEQPAHVKKYLDLPPKIRMNTPLNKIL